MLEETESLILAAERRAIDKYGYVPEELVVNAAQMRELRCSLRFDTPPDSFLGADVYIEDTILPFYRPYTLRPRRPSPWIS